jgi:hypothetical protein
LKKEFQDAMEGWRLNEGVEIPWCRELCVTSFHVSEKSVKDIFSIIPNGQYQSFSQSVYDKPESQLPLLNNLCAYFTIDIDMTLVFSTHLIVEAGEGLATAENVNMFATKGFMVALHVLCKGQEQAIKSALPGRQEGRPCEILSLSPQYCFRYILLMWQLFCAMNWLRNKRRISSQDLLEMLKRIDRAYRIVELNEKEPMILETDAKGRLFEVRSVKDKFYRVDADIKICSCPDFNFRFLKCKHIIAAEFASAGITS